MGHAFNNMMLHAVSEGCERTSYVVQRLVKKHSVSISTFSVLDGISRSSACAAFEKLLTCVEDDEMDVDKISWNKLSSS